MIDFLELFNKVARVARPAHHSYAPYTDMASRFEDGDLDSLDMLMMAMYMSDIYGIADEVSKEMRPETIQEMYDLIMQHKTQEPESIVAAMELIK
jgi:acyl carrier protein